MSNLHKIVSYWDGRKPLHYIHHICLASFVRAGHAVTLYTLSQNMQGLEVPDGVSLECVDSFRDGLSGKLTPLLPATAADFLRVMLIAELGAVWVDTDVFCIKPFYTKQSYIFAHEGENRLEPNKGGNINNAVLAFPKGSEALTLLNEYAKTQLGYIQSPSTVVKAYIDSGVGHAILKHGPRALTHFLSLTGEIDQQMHPKALYPIHFNLSDCYWDPDIDITKRFTDEAMATHIWDSQVRPGWYRRRALKKSFIWKAAKEFDVNMERLKRRK